MDVLSLIERKGEIHFMQLSNFVLKAAVLFCVFKYYLKESL